MTSGSENRDYCGATAGPGFGLVTLVWYFLHPFQTRADRTVLQVVKRWRDKACGGELGRGVELEQCKAIAKVQTAPRELREVRI